MRVVGEAHVVAAKLARYREIVADFRFAEVLSAGHAVLVTGNTSEEEFLPIEEDVSSGDGYLPEADAFVDDVRPHGDGDVVKLRAPGTPEFGSGYQLNLPVPLAHRNRNVEIELGN
jgi:hypothetical protein